MPQRSTGSRVYLSLIGLALALVGGLFAGLMWRSFQRARVVDAWPQVPCVILSSDVEERQIDPNGPLERRFAVLFGYEWEGVARDSRLLRLRGSMWTGKEDAIRLLCDRYPEGARRECRVNPADPAVAVLEPESKAPGYSLWFPLLFVVGGLGVMVGAWRR
ncbi:MAG: DUF3592 domain-containing protein [Verrucomicrobia bacterium]|nr:MAG: DUF3592 domain-containing protein [Verrucomicrobiota bacterium]TAE86276.1 MAG: DUF3592 domain-containing protein [Verrucomicrobiota bacterium]TAF23056.1 MAG: DUF3592 domain-containing protein [Verrucomicrobiota bacterium]TAF39947.1 MAG: DUF3592 domain-containing protein [Verrucomicrobiota bacterium]